MKSRVKGGNTMDWAELLQQIFTVCLVPLLGVLTAYLVALIKKKTQEISEKTSNALLQKYTNILSQVIIDCVVATKQTYVDELKDNRAFDAEAQKEAFNKCLSKIKSQLSSTLVQFITDNFGNLDNYIGSLIESTIFNIK